MANRYPKAVAEDADTHAWRGTVAFWPDDDLLRDHDFAIKGRPKGHPAVWVRGGHEYLFTAALALAESEPERPRKA